jgi:hypothetical protein
MRVEGTSTNLMFERTKSQVPHPRVLGVYRKAVEGKKEMKEFAPRY